MSETFHLKNSYGPDYIVKGRCIATAEDLTFRYELYLSDRGKYVCHRSASSKQAALYPPRTNACYGEGEVIKFFGWEPLAKELYKKAGIKYEVEV